MKANHLHYGQLTRCIQCPLYFRFQSNEPLSQQIRQQHQLQPQQQLPIVIQRLTPRIQAQSAWWPHQFSAEAQFYWRYLEPVILGNEPAFRLLVVDGDHSFFISSGDFHPQYYRPSTAAANN